MNKIDLVVFDMAGTTVQDAREVETCFAEACKAMNLAVSPERILALQGYAKLDVFKLLWKERISEHHPDYADNVELSYVTFRNILENHYTHHPIVPTEGCLEVFDFLRQQDIRIALTTGFYREVTTLILKKLGWLQGLDKQFVAKPDEANVIDASVCSDDVAAGRPAPDMIFRAMDLLHVTDMQRVIAIGDTPSDLLASQKAGCLYTLGVTNGTHTKEQLAAYPHHALLPNVAALIPFIENINVHHAKV